MSLRRALDELPDDRLARATVHAVVYYLHGHRLLHVDAAQVASVVRQDEDSVERILEVLAKHRVVDCRSDPVGYRLVADKVLELEVARYLRVSDQSSLQSNVERYRRVFGDR